MPKNNTIIDKSHSKKELIEIIEYFKIPCLITIKNNKFEVATHLWDMLTKTDFIFIPKDNQYLIKDVCELRKFLKSKNPKKTLSIKEREKTLFETKKIIHYCSNNYDISLSFFDDIIDVYNTAVKVSLHGDLTNVRKALKMLMNDPKKLYNVEPKLSPEMAKEIHIKSKLKKKTKYYKCEVKYGNFYLSFD